MSPRPDGTYVSRDLVPRVVTAVLLLPIPLLVFYTGGVPLLAVVLLITAIACAEFFGLARAAGLRPFAGPGVAVALVLALPAYFRHPEVDVLLVVLFMASMALWPWRKRATPDREFVADWTVTLFGILYTGGLLLHTILLRDLPGGLAWGSIALAGAAANDTGAYLVGSALGRRKMAPELSPNKTWEGAAGGFVAGFIAVQIVARLFQIAPVHGLALGIAVPLIVILGDLAESAFKRAAGAKDAGRLLPGHGGILDRIDGLMFALPLVYYYVLFTIGSR